MFLILFYGNVIGSFIGVLFSIVLINGQMLETCPNTIITAMTEYKQCVDYSYQLIFSLIYNELSMPKIQQRCSENNFAKCREMADRRLGGCPVFTQREALEVNYQMVEAGSRYWCSDYGLRLMEFYNKRAPDCYFRQQSLFRTCEREFPVINIYLKNYDDNYCRNQKAVMNCFQQIYERCLAHEDPALIRGYYETMWKATPCYTLDQQYLHNYNEISAQSNSHVVLCCVVFVIFILNLFNIK